MSTGDDAAPPRTRAGHDTSDDEQDATNHGGGAANGGARTGNEEAGSGNVGSPCGGAAAAQAVCAGCGAPCRGEPLQCPTCRDLTLAPAFFCDQDCFAASWAAHKNAHDVCCLPPFPTGGVAGARAARFRFTGALRPGLLSPKRAVPKAIYVRPDYAASRDGRSAAEERAYGAGRIPTMGADELARMRVMCRHGREILNLAAAAVRPGVTTDEIDRLVHDATVERGLYPSTLNYSKYPKSLCTSVNEVVCHGIPDSRPLADGDIVNLDISAFGLGSSSRSPDAAADGGDGAAALPPGLHTDLNETVLVGRAAAADAEAVRLVHCAFECMLAGMSALRPGALYRHVGEAIAMRAALDGFGIAREVVSHGVGRLFHCPPDIPHFAGNKAVGGVKAGHVVTIEPMINAGPSGATVQWPDGWTMTTVDGRYSAQFENTCAVVAAGGEGGEGGEAVPGSFLPCEVLTSLCAPYIDAPFYVRQLEQWGVAVPASRLPEIGLPAPFFGGPRPARSDVDGAVA